MPSANSSAPEHGVVSVWELKRGQRFKLLGQDAVYTFDHTDNAVCLAKNSQGRLIAVEGDAELFT